MGFRNLLIYVQRQIDNLLRLYRKYTKTYINNVVIYSLILEKHIEHLDLIFTIL